MEFRFATTSTTADADVLRTRLIHLGKRDPKTNTLGLDVFHERIYAEFAFARRHGLPLALVVLDVIGFSTINEQFGLAIGDEVLARMALTLRPLLRAEDFLCRWTDDKFFVLCRSTTGAQAVSVARRLQSRLEAERFPPKDIALKVAFGIAAFPDPRHGMAETLFVGALDALLFAKAGEASGVYLR